MDRHEVRVGPHVQLQLLARDEIGQERDVASSDCPDRLIKVALLARHGLILYAEEAFPRGWLGAHSAPKDLAKEALPLLRLTRHVLPAIAISFQT